MINETDLEIVEPFKWSAIKSRSELEVWYACSTTIKNGKPSVMLMHRLLLDGECCGMDVDHKNSDGLDNRRSNLRPCNRRLHHGNRRKRKHCTSIYKGVAWITKHQRWQATIGLATGNKYLGLFVSEVDAARAYDSAALSEFGEFSKTNDAMGILHERQNSKAN